MTDKKLKMEMVLEKIEGKYLMRDDRITYELRKYNLDELTQKFLFGIMYKISADFLKPIREAIGESFKILEYQLSIEDVKKELHIDYRIESDKRKIEKLLKELVNTPITISVFDEKNRRKEYINTNLINTTVLKDDKETLYISIDERILPLYRATADKFTIWGFDYIVLSEKKYTPRFYEYLVEFAKSIGTKNIDGIISKIIKVEDLYFELAIPESYNYAMLKERILETCKIEFLALNYDEEEREKFKLFKSFYYDEKKSPRTNKAGRRPIESITFNFELLEKTKNLLKGKKGEEATNPEKLEKRAEIKDEFYGTVAHITSNTVEQMKKANFENYIFGEKLLENINDYTKRVIDIKIEIRDNLNLSEIQDIAFEKALEHTIKNLKTSDIEEFEYLFRKYLNQNIEYWGKTTGKGKAKKQG